MHAQQKVAWFNLIVFTTAACLYLAAVPLLSWIFGRPWMSVAAPAAGVFGLCGLWGVAPAFYRARHGKPVLDERDRLLSVRAWQAGMVAFWEVFVLGCVGFWGFARYARGIDRINVPVELFPGLVFAAMIIFTVTQSLATLHYYGWRWSDATEK